MPLLIFYYKFEFANFWLWFYKMHISEGILSPAVLAGSALLCAAGVSIGLKKIKSEDIPAMGILSAAFFVASLVHIPIGPSSTHLILNGMLGLILGWKAFPCIIVALALQAVLFQFGGITTLGVNTLNMALPAVICFYLFSWAIKPGIKRPLFLIATFAAGSLSVLLAGLLVGFSLYLTGEEFLPVARLIVAVHIPVMIIEGFFTTACLSFIIKVKPEMLENFYAFNDTES